MSKTPDELLAELDAMSVWLPDSVKYAKQCENNLFVLQDMDADLSEAIAKDELVSVSLRVGAHVMAVHTVAEAKEIQSMVRELAHVNSEMLDNQLATTKTRARQVVAS